MVDTIFAHSSGAAPAAIAVVRISGVSAAAAVSALCGRLPPPRRASYRRLHDSAGDLLDHALVLWFPGPDTATGEDLAELHLHGGRAVIAAVEAALAQMPDLRRALPGEFTRRAFANGRVDLAEVEGLADLLAAETELQRRSAMAMAEGELSRVVQEWRHRLLDLSAAVEAVLDFADDDDVSALPPDFVFRLEALAKELDDWLRRPRASALREGFTVVLAGPPNAGKSTLFNRLIESEAAITSPVAGTTRDVLTRPVALDGAPFVFVDTAGLRTATADSVEAIGIERAQGAVARADLVLWLGPEGGGPAGAWDIDARIDEPGHAPKRDPAHRVSAVSGAGLDGLRRALVEAARMALPRPGDVALSERQHRLVRDAALALGGARDQADPLLMAEHLRMARAAFDSLVGRTGTEDMLDALFGRFCIGK